jgi:hypothetical protein
LNDADKKTVGQVVNAFRNWLEDQERGENGRSVPLMVYGRELLGFPEDSPEAAVWYGFYGGFGAGCVYMAGDMPEEK